MSVQYTSVKLLVASPDCASMPSIPPLSPSRSLLAHLPPVPRLSHPSLPPSLADLRDGDAADRLQLGVGARSVLLLHHPPHPASSPPTHRSHPPFPPLSSLADLHHGDAVGPATARVELPVGLAPQSPTPSRLLSPHPSLPPSSPPPSPPPPPHAPTLPRRPAPW